MIIHKTPSLLLLLVMGWGGAISCTSQAAEQVSFVTCPIARDIGPDSDLCFIAEYNGQAYGLLDDNGYNRPMLKHKLLVEGEIVEGEKVCGATRIKGALSVMRDEISPECNQVLPNDGTVVAKNNNLFLRIPEQQRIRAFRLMDEVADNPESSLQEAILDPPPLQPVEPPFSVQKVDMHYPFNSKRSSGPELRKLLYLVHYMSFSGGHITVDSYQGATLLDNGTEMVEKETMAKERADMFKELLSELGVEETNFTVQIHTDPAQATGIDDWKNRRLSVVLHPES